ncbi:IclR family transcriptional regulator [Nocardia sp. CA2R105]|uniref:IclR family transcriptional regulator n=1 Tax=Nocardia coffeae TaxID=2873381 RepID=UPI001CA7A112|nr:IclR family transcriptional regulator [Nocardia coffeae]MBY8863181.1 IclR family transcriptional regulator [Nocardia coffeae]
MGATVDEAALQDKSVLGRIMRILDAFDVGDQAVGLSELARRTGLAKATVHRIAQDLVTARLLAASPQGYRLGRGLFELGMRAAAERTMLEVAVPFLQDLFARTRETVHLGVLDGDEVVYISKIGGHRQARSPSRIGGRMPLYCTAIGKTLLANSDQATIARILAGPLPRRTPRTIVAPGLLRAHLEQVAEQGVAYEYEESTLGIVCVAAPVLSADDQPLAAISVTGPATRFRPDAHAASVRAAAAGVASILARRSSAAE